MAATFGEMANAYCPSRYGFTRGGILDIRAVVAHGGGHWISIGCIEAGAAPARAFLAVEMEDARNRDNLRDFAAATLRMLDAYERDHAQPRLARRKEG